MQSDGGHITEAEEVANTPSGVITKSWRSPLAYVIDARISSG
jgi:hypothetical protein